MVSTTLDFAEKYLLKTEVRTVAVMPDEAATVQEALRIADERMYEEKEQRKRRKIAEC